MFESFLKAVENEIINAFKRAVYFQLEYDCHTTITDKDMLKMQIDWALENGDHDKFMELTNQLKELENATKNI